MLTDSNDLEIVKEHIMLLMNNRQIPKKQIKPGLKTANRFVTKTGKIRKFKNQKPVTTFSFEMLEAVIDYR